jgi:uncharacterized BrkB/YihY/UPF0761 family membrane protein
MCAMNAIAAEGRGMKMLLVGAVGILTLQVLLFWCYMVLVERSGSIVVRGVLGAVFVAAMLGLWVALSNLLGCYVLPPTTA